MFSLPNHGDSRDQSLEEFSGRLFAIFFWRRLFRYATLWCFFWGMFVLCFRVGMKVPHLHSWLGLLALPFLAGLAGIHAQRELPERVRLLEILDRRHHAGGLLVASAEVDLLGWSSRVPRLPPPALVWKKQRYVLFTLAAIFFWLGAGFVPIHLLRFGDDSLDVGFETANLTDKIETLKNEGIISREKSEEFKNQLESLKVESTGEDPGKTLEALDHLEDLARKSAQEAAADAMKATENLTKAENLAESLKDPASQSSPEQKEQAMKDLAEYLKEAAKSSAMSQQALEQGLMRQLQQQQSLSPQDLQKILQHCRVEKVYISEKLRKLLNKEMLDQKTLDQQQKMGRQPGEGQGSGEGGSGSGSGQGSGEGGSGQGSGSGPKVLDVGSGAGSGKGSEIFLIIDGQGGPGTGGTSRGRGDANLNFSGQTREDKMTFKEEALPPGDFSSWKEAAVTGMAVGAPQLETPEQSKGGALSQGTSGGSSAVTRKILPRYRPAVKKYFERK